MKQQICPIVWLQDWYYSQCDGDWEHNENILITTIDNPGWRCAITLEGTMMEDIVFTNESVDKTETDWYRCWVENNVFIGFGGPYNLLNLIEVFKDWVKRHDVR